MQIKSNAIHVDPDDPFFLGCDIITQEEAIENGDGLEEEDPNMTDEERIDAYWEEVERNLK